MDIQKLLNSTSAGQIAKQLDAQDGKQDGKISASIWNAFVQDKGGKEIQNYISVENAMNSVTTYAMKNANKQENTSANSLAEGWLKGLNSTEKSEVTPHERPDFQYLQSEITSVTVAPVVVPQVGLPKSPSLQVEEQNQQMNVTQVEVQNESSEGMQTSVISDEVTEVVEEGTPEEQAKLIENNLPEGVTTKDLEELGITAEIVDGQVVFKKGNTQIQKEAILPEKTKQQSTEVVDQSQNTVVNSETEIDDKSQALGKKMAETMLDRIDVEETFFKANYYFNEDTQEYTFRGLRNKNLSGLQSKIYQEINTIIQDKSTYLELNNKPEAERTEQEKTFMTQFEQRIAGHGLQLNQDNKLEDIPSEVSQDLQDNEISLVIKGEYDKDKVSYKGITHFRYNDCPADKLVSVGKVKVHKDLANAFEEMQQAAKQDGVNLNIVSGFRSIEDQRNRVFVKKFTDKENPSPQEFKERLKWSAPSEYSEHHTGLSIDINSTEESFGNTDAFKWLKENASRFGFEQSFTENNKQGVGNEPWHWRFIGKNNEYVEIFEAARKFNGLE